MAKFKKPNFKSVVKTVVKWTVGASVGTTVTKVIANNVDPEDRAEKAQAYVGGAVVGYMAAEAAEDWTDSKIDDLFSFFKKSEAPENDPESTPEEVQ